MTKILAGCLLTAVCLAGGSRLGAQSAIETRHTVEIDGTALDYTATAGTIPLTDGEGTTLANVFFISYWLDGIEDRSDRPLLFSFNGGPGVTPD